MSMRVKSSTTCVASSLCYSGQMLFNAQDHDDSTAHRYRYHVNPVVYELQRGVSRISPPSPPYTQYRSRPDGTIFNDVWHEKFNRNFLCFLEFFVVSGNDVLIILIKNPQGALARSHNTPD